MLTKINSRIKRRQGGFTLIELLLVVAILAVLAFLAVPAIAETIRNARVRTCASNEKMVEDAVWRWYADGIAAGLTVGNVTVEDGLTIGSAATPSTLVAQFNAGKTAPTPMWPALHPYFTPGSVPRCPFGGVDTYLIDIVVSDAGLDDVLVICNDSEDGGGTVDHPRSADRRDSF